MTTEVFDLLTKAGKISQTMNISEIHTRHLVAALISQANDEEKTSIQTKLENIGVSLSDLRKSYLDHLKQIDSQNADVWGQILAEPTLIQQKANMLAGYHSDGQEGEEDLLGIDEDVNAFAALIASHAIKPPLSVGLFGQWGSGKTFFMRRLRKRINKLARLAQNSGKLQKDIPFYKRIAQIEFNAWHYVEGNLWASLVEHIFRNLSIDGQEEDKIEKLRENLLNKLNIEKTAETLADEEVTKAKEALREIEGKLNLAKNKLVEQTQTLENIKLKDVLAEVELNSSVQDNIEEILTELNIEEVKKESKSLIGSLSEARAVLERGNALVTPLIKGKGKEKRLILLIVFIFAAPVVSIIINILLSNIGSLNPTGATTISGIATLLGTGAVWIRKQAEWLSTWVDKAEKAQQQVDSLVAKKQTELQAQITKLEKDFDVSKSEYELALQATETAKQRVAKAEAELKEATSGRLLAKFIQDRAASEDYRKHLGVLALVRNDFEQLSDFIETENRQLIPKKKDEEHFKRIEDEEEDKDVRINRIVLYIDDLDRCPPNKVVDVLQAVHLLLAFPLFVVVVGVDARWITRSLETRYRELLHSSSNGEIGETNMQLIGSATPDDYLEKIFQIPFWLNPMDKDASQTMVNKLIGDNIIESEKEQLPSSTDVETKKMEGISSEKVSEEVEDSEFLQQDSDSNKKENNIFVEKEEQKPKPPDDKHLLNQQSLEIYREEQEFINELSPLLGRSPRSLKRFVNVYRLIKVGLSDDELKSFLISENDLKDFEAVLFLLAIDTGFPSISEEFFRYLVKSPNSLELESFFENIKSKNPMDYQQIKIWLEPKWNKWRTEKSLKQISKWIPQVSRYSFIPRIK